MNQKKPLRKFYVTFIIIFWGLWSFPQICTALDIFRPDSFTDLASKTTAPTNAYDADPGTSADIETNADAFPSIIFDDWPVTTPGEYSSLRLYVNRSSTGHIDDKWGIKYSTNGGSSWSSLDSMSSQYIEFASDISVALDTSLDLSDLKVRIDTDRNKKADSGQVQIYEIWVEGEIAPTPILTQSAYRFFGTTDSSDFYEKVNDITDPVPGTDKAQAIAIDGTHMYVVGFEVGKWRIEKRELVSGSLDYKIINDDSPGKANAIAIDDTYMYVVGSELDKWRIEKRYLENGNLETDFGVGGVVTSDPSENNDVAHGIAIYDGYMYIVGSDRSLGASDAQWRIEKRDCETSSLVEEIVVNFSVDNDIPYAIAVDGGSMYVVGYDRFPGSSSKPGKGKKGSSSSNAEWRIEKISLSDLSLQGSVSSNPTDDFDTARGIAIDGTHMYVIGSDELGLGLFGTQWRIEKRSLSNLSPDSNFGTAGIITADYGSDDRPTGIAIDGTHMYVAGFSADFGGGGDTAWRIEKRLLSDGSLVAAVVNDIDSEGNDRALAIAIDTAPIDPADHTMYVAGYFTNSSLPDWRIVKRELSDLSLDLLEDLLDPLAAQDTPVNRNYLDEFRLRMLLHVDGDPLPLNLYQFKLQYSVDGSPFSDITDQTDIAFKDNPIASDGTAILGIVGDPLHFPDTTIEQTFEEANNFTNSVEEIGDGEDGMWDFSLFVNSAASATYSFRIVREDGTPLVYSIYPEVTVP
jgi:hypothetical protein